MQFKMGKSRIVISFSFFAIILILMIVDKRGIVPLSLLASFLHELVHCIFIFIFTGAPKEIKISILGGEIRRKNNVRVSVFKEFIIYASAPLFNIISGLLLYNDKYLNASFFSQINLFLGLFNILPFYSFDGGKMLECILQNKLSAKKASTIITVVSIITTSLFCICALITNMYLQKNVSMIIIALFMVLSMFFKK